MERSTISHYKIVEKLGQGGMGVVYRAEDTKLDRPVALKFLPSHLLGDEDIRRRFEREAKAAAALDHPNVCHVYEIDEADGKSFIAMSLIEGESLDKRIAKGPLKLEEALEITQQVARGLEAAHKRGIVHRDIKPENIMVSTDGHVTIMDFGLAQLTEASRLTKTDETVGTVAYMSPEQTEGSGTDHRTDIWSLGVVLYEMATGQQPFKGDYDKAVMYSILNEEPEPITALRTGVPMELEGLVRKCLAKEQQQRYQHTDEIAIDLAALQTRTRSFGPPPKRRGDSADASAPAVRTQLRVYQALLAASLMALIAAGIHFATSSPPEPERPVRRFSIVPESLADVPRPAAISPDGKRIAYIAGPGHQLWIRELDKEEPQGLNAYSVNSLFWSPDSQSIGYASDGSVWWIGTAGGSPILVCKYPHASFTGGAWSPDGQSILFSSTGGGASVVFEVPTSGGEPTKLLEPGGDPVFLPNPRSRRIAYSSRVRGVKGPISVSDFKGEPEETSVEGTLLAYSPGDLVLFQPERLLPGLWAVSTRSGDWGEPFLVDAVGQGASVSGDGTLVYTSAGAEWMERLIWKDRNGSKGGDIGRPLQRIIWPRLSPDQRYVATRSTADGNGDMWVHEVGRPVASRMTPPGGLTMRAAWRPDGQEIAFGLVGPDSGKNDIWIGSATGIGDARLVVELQGNDYSPDWSRNGKTLIFHSISDESQRDLWTLDGGGEDAEPRLFLQTPFNEQNATFSPDGRFVAYVSDESGRREVYVREFPAGSNRWQVSLNGGAQQRWSPKGDELFFVSGDSLMAVPIVLSPDFSPGQPTELFSDSSLRSTLTAALYDVAADGQRFVLTERFTEGESRRPEIRVVENWYEEFRGRTKN